MPTTSILLNLPYELLEKICSYADQHSCVTLCCISRLLHDFAEPWLYKNVTIVDGRAKPFMLAIKKRPYLLPYIESVSVHYIESEESGCALAPLLETFPNLREFHLKSGFWHWSDSDGYDEEYDKDSGVEWQDEQRKLCQFFEKNSLLAANEDRILLKFESCEDFRLLHSFIYTY